MESPKLQQKLPVINFSKEDLQHGTESWSMACKEIRHAFEEYGCFIAVFDKIPTELRDKMFSALDGLFDLPIDTKIKNTYDTPFFGYFGQQRDIPLHESMGIEDVTNIEEIKKFSKLMWPHGNDDNFGGIVHEYANLLSELEQMVTRIVFESYEVEKLQCDSHLDSKTYLLRFNTYRAPEEDETTLGSLSHTDKTFITILDQNEVNGLEVKLKDDDEQWIPVEFLPSSFVVMAGEALLAWSNNRIRPCYHRVVMNSNVRRRYSVGIFSFHKGVIQIPPELIDEENPQAFKPFDHLGLLPFFAQQYQRGQVSGCSIKDYCGL